MKIGIRKIIYSAITILFFAFTFQSIPPSGWYQQNITGIGSRTISDIFFLDSLTGWAVTPYVSQNDTVFILKTTNGGDNWLTHFKSTGQFAGLSKVYFLNHNTGFACGVGLGDNLPFIKTTNGGNNWFSPSSSGLLNIQDMHVLNADTIWLAKSDQLTGGVFRTTNGGINWTQQINLGNQNPNKIYMYNSRIGFISHNTGTRTIRKTTNGGANWTLTINNDYFLEMYFPDSLTGWKANGADFGSMKKTTDGGMNWISQQLPLGGGIQLSSISSFSNINKDTIWGVGSGYIFYPNFQTRTILYRTTNGGTNWYFQLPDTSLKYSGYKIKFADKNHGWVYSSSPIGIHTKVGGDTTFYLTSTENISTIIPKDYYLNQNYPNPFNPVTKISFLVKRKTGNVKLNVFDLSGKLISELVNQNFNPGSYEVNFNGNNLSSGTYFYSLYIDNHLVDTKKMLLLK